MPPRQPPSQPHDDPQHNQPAPTHNTEPNPDSDPNTTDPDAEQGPEHRQFTVTRDPDKRLDVYLQQRLKGISRSRIQKLIDLGGVTVNGQTPKHSTPIHQGDRIDVILPPRAVRTILPEPIPIDAVYEDDSFIIINKQANLIVHPARSHLSGTLLNGLAHRFKQAQERAGKTFQPRATRGFSKQDRKSPTTGQVDGLSAVGAQEFRPGIVHRLDKNTTGVLVVAKSDEAHWAIAKQFEARQTLKAYLALVHGNIDTIGGVIEQPLGKHPTIREAMAVRHDSSAKHAVTLFRVREQYRGYSLVELELKTGRTHQIRVHLSYIGHPIVGDILYGGEPIGTPELDTPPTPAGARRDLTFARDKDQGLQIETQAAQRDDLIIAHPALHATLLQFTHPATQKTVTFTAPLHEPMRSLVRELRHRPTDGPTASDGYWVDLNTAVPSDT